MTNFRKIASRSLIVAVAGVVGSGIASAVTISGTTTGAFNAGSLTNTATLGGLTYMANTAGFSVQTDEGSTGGDYFIGSAAAGDNLGMFSLNTSTFNYNGNTFKLAVAFTNPVLSTTTVVPLTGRVTTVGGGVTINFSGPGGASNYTLADGSTFSFYVNPVTITKGGSNVLLTGGGTFVQATPEPFTMTLGAAGLGLAIRRRARKNAKA